MAHRRYRLHARQKRNSMGSEKLDDGNWATSPSPRHRTTTTTTCLSTRHSDEESCSDYQTEEGTEAVLTRRISDSEAVVEELVFATVLVRILLRARWDIVLLRRCLLRLPPRPSRAICRVDILARGSCLAFVLDRVCGQPAEKEVSADTM
jgi:hypothetical protein